MRLCGYTPLMCCWVEHINQNNGSYIKQCKVGIYKLTKGIVCPIIAISKGLYCLLITVAKHGPIYICFVSQIYRRSPHYERQSRRGPDRRDYRGWNFGNINAMFICHSLYTTFRNVFLDHLISKLLRCAFCANCDFCFLQVGNRDKQTFYLRTFGDHIIQVFWNTALEHPVFCQFASR